MPREMALHDFCSEGAFHIAVFMLESVQMKGLPQPRREVIPSADASRGAVDHLFQSESTRLQRYFRFKTGDREGAADFVQDAFVKMMEAPVAEIRNPAAYLQRIARNLLVDWFRDRRSKPHSEGMPLHECDAAIAPQQEDLSLFEDAIRGLSDKTRTVFLLKRVECLTYQQIAKQLSISAKTVEYHMTRAIAHIDLFLEEQ